MAVTDLTTATTTGSTSEGSSLRLSRYHVCSPIAVVEGLRVRVVMATRTGEVVRIAAELWDRLVDGDLAPLSPEMVAELAEIELLVDDGDELEVVLGRSNRAIDTSDVLKLVVQPTAACQLDCVYCGQHHTSAKLCSEHQQAVIERAEEKLRTGRYRLLSMGWFGAEPLLGLDVIEAMTPRLVEAATAHGCAFDAAVVTNGLRLTPEVAARLEALRVSLVEVTIDGPAPWHDRQRPYKSGRPSFGRILRNVVDVAATRPRFAISLRCNVTAASAPDVPDFIDLLDALGLQQGVDRVYFAPIHSWGNGAERLSLDRATFARAEAGWMARLLRLGFTPSTLPTVKPIVCMATMPTAELVDAHGDIFSCTEVSYVPSYGSPNRYAIGDLAHGTDPRRHNLLGDFNRRIHEGEVPCRKCPLLPVCGGSCPKSWREGDSACPSFKWNLPTRLLLELGRQQGPVDDGAVRARPDPAVALAGLLAGPSPADDNAPVAADHRADRDRAATPVRLGPPRRHPRPHLAGGSDRSVPTLPSTTGADHG